ncbi:MAG: hypothetical protein K9L17_12645 [Clostridiales bacterium]|nr:hypothetical protein [Clostridiales bacterium]MCF8023527.1 hypothetical protein [Clostridiales bacterium]
MPLGRRSNAWGARLQEGSTTNQEVLQLCFCFWKPLPERSEERGSSPLFITAAIFITGCAEEYEVKHEGAGK